MHSSSNRKRKIGQRSRLTINRLLSFPALVPSISSYMVQRYFIISSEKFTPEETNSLCVYIIVQAFFNPS